jgi:putative polymerase
VLLILAVVTAVGLVEAFLPDLYSSTFNVQDYYILTRGNVADDFYTKDSTLYVSAIRGDERFFSFLDIPRMSSIFLEPVSLGNYCTIMVAYFCARFWRLSALTLFAGGLAIAFLLVGSDGRLAATSAILIIAVCLLAPSLPRFSAAIYLPLAIMAAGGVVFVMNPSPYTDDFPGRLAYTMDLLGQLRLSDWLGVSGTSGEEAMDSGIAYLILTQSLIGTALIWLFLTCLSEQKTREQIRYIHALLLYLALTMTVSYSMLTIKTAALAWFIHGILQQPGRKKRVAHLPGK